MQSNKPKPTKKPSRPDSDNEPMDLPDVVQPPKRKPKEARPGVSDGRGTPAERGGSLEKAPGEPGREEK